MMLVELSRALEFEYYQMLKEFHFNDEQIDVFNIGYESKDFTYLLKRLDENFKGIQLSENFVPNSTYWFMNTNKELLGFINLRHHLTDSLRVDGGHLGYAIRPSQREKGYGTILLQMGLEKAKDFGLEKVMLSVMADNKASIKVIEKNGGIIEQEHLVNGEISRNYWIDLSLSPSKKHFSKIL